MIAYLLSKNEKTNKQTKKLSSVPRVKECAILKCAIVVVADVISSHCCARAAFRHFLCLHDYIILGVKDINYQHLEYQRGLRRDHGSCWEERSMFMKESY